MPPSSAEDCLVGPGADKEMARLRVWARTRDDACDASRRRVSDCRPRSREGSQLTRATRASVSVSCIPQLRIACINSIRGIVKPAANRKTGDANH